MVARMKNTKVNKTQPLLSETHKHGGDSNINRSLQCSAVSAGTELLQGTGEQPRPSLSGVGGTLLVLVRVASDQQ